MPFAVQTASTNCACRRSPTEVSQDSPANSVDPPYPNHAQKLPPVSQLPHSQAQTVLLHVNPGPPQPPLHHAVAWDPHHQPVARQHSTSQAPWSMVEPVETPNAASAVYPPPQDMGQDWAVVARGPPEHELYVQHQVPAEHMDRTTAQLLAQSRPQTKKKAAKVPSSFVERQEKLKVSKRKGPLQERQREKTHTMRKTKRICVRCRFYKSGCDEGDPCEKCEKITGHARSFREPCFREHLEDTSLIRRCNGREHQEEAEFLAYDWIQNSQLYEMEIIWNLPGYGPIPNAQPLRIAFRPYSPKRGSLDVATSVWSNRDGQVPSVEQPAYAIYDTANLVLAFERYFSSLQPAIEEWIFARIRQDEVAYHTYQEVVRMRRVTGSRALDLAMRLQCLSVVSQGYGSVFSNNIPGIREYDYRRLGRSDYEAYDRKSCDRPLPGAINHQMDVAAVKYLRKLEKLFVKELAALIFKPKIKPWYELFLAFYVIFWNLEYIHHGAQDYIKSKNGTLIENQVSNVVTTQIKKWEFAFPVLLYHWRCILRGYSPFKLARDNPDELRERGHIDTEGFQYVTRIATLFDRNNPDRFQPPLTGFVATHWSTSSEWIVKLFKEAGA
ncbi:GAL4 multi-domain protein [Pyrenophora tritici-repentis]|nr:GAL4 multi-domain protein [Pyrenophora tritici-repentis]